MTLKIPGETLTFFFQFTASKAGKTGLTVTTDVYDTDKSTLLVNNGATTEIALGLYYYTLAAVSNDAAGDYLAIASTTDTTVDLKDVPALWTVRGTLDLTETATGDGLPNTLSGLRWMLRVRLNDILADGNSAGNYTTKHLDMFINLAYRETVFKAKCHKAAESVTLVATQHTYALTYIFEPIELVGAISELKRKTLSDAGVSIYAWNTEPQGTPTMWMQLTGDSIRVHPTADTAATGMISTIADAPIVGGTGYAVGDILSVVETGASGGKVIVTAVAAGVVTEVKLSAGGITYTTGTKATTKDTGSGASCTVSISTVGKLTANGYAYPVALTLDAHTISALPTAYGVSAVLDRAECFARRARPTTANNVGLAERLEKNWEQIVENIKSSLRAEG